jgi:hypothetical protein
MQTLTVASLDSAWTFVRDFANHKPAGEVKELGEVLAALISTKTSDVPSFHALALEYTRAAYAARFVGLDSESIRRETPAAVAAPEVTEVPAPAVPNGTYTVLFDADDDSDYVTLDVCDDWRSDAPAGSQVVKYLRGLDNWSNYKGFAFLRGTEVRIWRNGTHGARQIQALTILLNGAAQGKLGDMSRAYGIRSGKCGICGRKLTTPESLAYGIGPVCRDKSGW